MLELGDISLILNVASLFLVSIGVIGRKRSRNSYRLHGYLSVFGFILKLSTVFAAMIPPLFFEVPDRIVEYSLFQLSFVAAKLFVGILGTVLGFVCIVPWLVRSRKDSECLKWRRWMMPTLILWILSVILGAAVHLGEII